MEVFDFFLVPGVVDVDDEGGFSTERCWLRCSSGDLLGSGSARAVAGHVF